MGQPLSPGTPLLPDPMPRGPGQGRDTFSQLQGEPARPASSVSDQTQRMIPSPAQLPSSPWAFSALGRGRPVAQPSLQTRTSAGLQPPQRPPAPPGPGNGRPLPHPPAQAPAGPPSPTRRLRLPSAPRASHWPGAPAPPPSPGLCIWLCPASCPLPSPAQAPAPPPTAPQHT